ncbi:hypothetical protein Ciccas_010488 [Cichlidogyrus casuarinus]|uniref:G-protein coupled receptors family 1 profile domain-containing protein n=1 Tax=Cichlidogyrus casuarinus TaxID=1844966 RepID=A0ABD2PTY6_9PLAT
MNRYDELPPFKGPDGYPKQQMEDVIAGIKSNDLSVYNPEEELVKAAYDPYLIDVPWLASTVHAFMTVMAAVSIVGILGNLLCLPWLNSQSNRTGATLYMTLAAICDIFYIVGVWLLLFYQLFNATITSQLQIYQNWTVHLIPYGLPLTNLFGLISTWLLVALLVDRLPVAAQTVSPQTDLNLDEDAKAAVYQKRSRCRYTFYFFLMVLFLSFYTVPTLFEYSVDQHKLARKPALVQYLVSFKQYKIAMCIVLKPIVEILLPSVLLIWYVVLIRDKKYGLKQRAQGYFVPNLIKNWDEDEQCHDTQQDALPSDDQLDKVDEAAPIVSTYMIQPVLDLSFLECKRWRNESIVSRMAINIAFIYLLNMFVQAMCYFVRVDTKTNRELREIFFYIGIIINVFVVSMKPITYLLTSKTVIKEFKEIQKSATSMKAQRPNPDAPIVIPHSNLQPPYPSALGWRLMKNGPDGEQILV